MKFVVMLKVKLVVEAVAVITPSPIVFLLPSIARIRLLLVAICPLKYAPDEVSVTDPEEAESDIVTADVLDES